MINWKMKEESFFELAIYLSLILEESGTPIGEYTSPALHKALLEQFAPLIQNDEDKELYSRIISIVGNRMRWDSAICKKIVFFALDWLADYYPNRANLPQLVNDDLSLRSSKMQVVGQRYAVSWTAPFVDFGKPRTISFEQNVKYPNLTKSRGNFTQYMRRVRVMRYLLGDRDTPPELQPFPEFEIRTKDITRTLSSGAVMQDTETVVYPELSDLPGEAAKFSYCDIAEEIQCLIVKAVATFAGYNDTSKPVPAPNFFALWNLLLTRSDAFYLEPSDQRKKLIPLTGYREGSLERDSDFYKPLGFEGQLALIEGSSKGAKPKLRSSLRRKKKAPSQQTGFSGLW